jgi:uncharacterized membrane protein
VVNTIRNHFWRHGRFYSSLLIGIAAWFAASALPWSARFLAAGDAFCVILLSTILVMALRITPDKLRARAASEDVGIVLIFLITFAIIAVSVVAIVLVLKQKHGISPLQLVLAVSGIPLGWFTLHSIAAFHYADLYYARKESGPQSVRGLEFPDTKEPGAWDFLYYAFTIGTTAQTSDTNLRDTKMRVATLGHSVVSFFYNTAIIAMSVNAVIAIAS